MNDLIQKIYSFFKREYWFPKSLETNKDPIDAINLEFEKEPDNFQKSINLEHISKVKFKFKFKN